MNYNIPGATWGDVFVAGNGRIGCVYDLGIDVIVDFMAVENGTLRKKDSIIFNFTEKVLFARGDKNNLGHILVMGQGGTTGKFRLKSSAGSYDPPVPLTTAATQVCDLQPIDNGFHYVVQTSPTTYYDSITTRQHIIPGLPEGTSQGLIQLLNSDIHWSDLWRAVIPNMGYPFQTENIFCGEGSTDPHHIQALEGNEQKNIYWGTAERPRACLDLNNNIYVVASRGPNGVTFNFYNRPLPNLGIVDPPIPPVEEPMELPEAVKNTLADFEEKFPLPTGEDNIREWTIKANEQVAFEHPTSNYGCKKSTNTSPTSKDSIAQKLTNKLISWDLVLGSGTNNPETNYEEAESTDISNQVFIGPHDVVRPDGSRFTPQNHIDGTVEPPIDPPDTGDCPDTTPVVPTQDVIRDSLTNLRAFCQNYIAPSNALPQYANTKPYVNDEIHDNGLFIGDGLIYFMMSDTGRWAQILMNPSDTRPWNEKRADADNALFTYMRRRVGDNS